ncbi:ran-binding protein 10-like [Tripterygium wilfordii]|uniref:Ran-binding protein 10-like n=1 Tax=Tripterygium wilfordii TaxID=458696 RepID=A0A7J7CF73_TRIWF|nr:ran-binding protein M homolog [Tripterygium wilfordii]KAF5732798.1 ran-binding protein 10-like [Tripterygium wilfordii]
MSITNNDNNSNSNSNSNYSNSGDRDLGLYFLELVRQRSSLAAALPLRPGLMDQDKKQSQDQRVIGVMEAPGEVDEDDGEEELPTELNTINSSGGFLVVSTDKLSVKYTSVNLHGHDVGVVQANKPAPVKRLVYYFEIFVKNAGVKGQIAIGFTSESFKMRRQPGWEANSCGYHGDDGHLYRGQGKGDDFGPTFTTNDTVGGGINYASQEIFFTKNGTIVGTVYKDIKGPLFPTVAVHSQNEEIEVNFGQRPFAFDLKEYEAQERMRQQMTIEKISLLPNVSHVIVRAYLLHYGYEETLDAFDLASKSTIPPINVPQENGVHEEDMAYALNQRKAIRQLIRNGEVDAAFSKLQEWYPKIVQDEKSATCFLLHCQKFIELVRVGALEEAVRYGRNELARFFGLAGFADMVQDCVALLAYEHPQESSVGYLLKDSQRELVADTVNAMILSTNPRVKNLQGCLHSCLERLLRQLSACCLERRSLNGDQGEAFRLRRVLNSGKKAKF